MENHTNTFGSQQKHQLQQVERVLSHQICCWRGNSHNVLKRRAKTCSNGLLILEVSKVDTTQKPNENSIFIHQRALRIN